jgi:hypothetical protein
MILLVEGETETINVFKILETWFYSELLKERNCLGDLAIGINAAGIKFNSGVYVVLCLVQYSAMQ